MIDLFDYRFTHWKLKLKLTFIFFFKLLQIQSKKRRRLEHQKLQDLVYVKYNQDFVNHFNSRDVIDLVVLNDIDESNDWLLGELEEEKNAKDELVFQDNDLSWLHVKIATRASEPLKYTKRQTQMKKVNDANERGKKGRESSFLMLVGMKKNYKKMSQILKRMKIEDFEF